MTAKALLLISVELGDETNVLKKLKSIQNVKEAHLTSGVYDIIAIVEAETQGKLKDTITYQIRALREVRTTLTMVVVGNENYHPIPPVDSGALIQGKGATDANNGNLSKPPEIHFPK
ncbi:MAG: Lrp/AsnC ligand binding domain-containing protein [Thaumarchaeota archaeon]|nr:Lrp/AsnC ligand binding domain-containing protein [Nitrososphaerota archaeon]